MKFFKVTLNTIGKDNEKVIFIIPPAEEKDENGNPAYDEDFLLNNVEYKSYIKETKAAVVSVAYILYEADDSTKLNYDELLNNEDNFFKLDHNDYLIEVKKAKPKSGGNRSSTTAFYFIIGIVAAAVVIMLIYGSSIKKGGNDPAENDDSTVSDILADTNSTPSESETAAEIISSIESETGEESYEAPTAPTVTTTSEVTYTLIFDKNGGAGSFNEAEYPSGTVVELPFTNISRIGYTLMGWATAPTQPYTLYDNETNRYVMASSSATLYAIWTASEYEVTYHYQIGSNSVTSKDRVKYGETIQLMDIGNFPSNAGKFVGWGLLPDTDEPVKSLTMPDGGIELYAIYK